MIQIKVAGFPPWQHRSMATYRVEFVDHGGRVYDAIHINRDSDEEAISEAHRRNVAFIGAGFDVWHDERLVHHHRN